MFDVKGGLVDKRLDRCAHINNSGYVDWRKAVALNWREIGTRSLFQNKHLGVRLGMFHIPQLLQSVCLSGQLKVNCEPLCRWIEQLAAKAYLASSEGVIDILQGSRVDRCTELRQQKRKNMNV